MLQLPLQFFDAFITRVHRDDGSVDLHIDTGIRQAELGREIDAELANFQIPNQIETLRQQIGGKEPTPLFVRLSVRMARLETKKECQADQAGEDAELVQSIAHGCLQIWYQFGRVRTLYGAEGICRFALCRKWENVQKWR